MISTTDSLLYKGERTKPPKNTKEIKQYQSYADMIDDSVFMVELNKQRAIEENNSFTSRNRDKLKRSNYGLYANTYHFMSEEGYRWYMTTVAIDSPFWKLYIPTIELINFVENILEWWFYNKVYYKPNVKYKRPKLPKNTRNELLLHPEVGGDNVQDE